METRTITGGGTKIRQLITKYFVLSLTKAGLMDGGNNHWQVSIQLRKYTNL